MPHNRDWLSIDPDERIVWSSHPSKWIVWTKVLLGFVVLFAVLRIIQLIPFSSAKLGAFRLDFLILLIAVIGGFGPAAYAHIVRKTTMYVITNKAVWYKKGIYKRESVDMIKLHEVADREYNGSYFDRFVDKGQFQIMTKGTGKVDMEFWDVPNPSKVNNILKDAQNQARTQRAPGDQQQPQDAQNWRNKQYAAEGEPRQAQSAGEQQGGQARPRQQQPGQQGPTGGQGHQNQRHTERANAQQQRQQPPQNQHQQNQNSRQSQQREPKYSEKETRDTDSLHHPAYDENGDDGPHYID